jgi:ADP-ribosylglycohydrolase
MLGSIIADVIGSEYEWDRVKYKNFELFREYSTYTDDSVMTISTAFSLLHNVNYGKCYRAFARAYPNRGYGGMFQKWIESDTMGPYNSFGNGSAMRVSPIGFAFNTQDEIMEEAKKSAEVSHSHPEGILGAQATAMAIFLARQKLPREDIRAKLTELFGYDLNRTCDQIRPEYSFNETCQETVPQAIIAFLDSTDYEDAVRLAISLGGDSDTLACITGGIAQAYYPMIPKIMAVTVLNMLPKSFLRIILDFDKKYDIHIKVS